MSLLRDACDVHGASATGRVRGVGKIQMVFVNYPLARHPYARKAGEAAECAGKQGRFWEMYNWLFDHQTELDETSLVRHAEEVGLNRKIFVSCLSTGITATEIEADLKTASRLGVSSTPHFFLGRRTASGDIRLLKRIRGTAPISTFRAAISEISNELPR
jgi:protein-disulfide isomerase